MTSSGFIQDIQPKLFMSLICTLNIIPCWLLRREMLGPLARMLNLSTLAFGVGMPLLLFKDELPRTLIVITGNMLVLGAMGLLWQAVVGLEGRRPATWRVLPAPLAWAALWLVPLFRHQLDLRIAIAAGLSGLLILLALVEILRSGRSALDLPRRLLLATGLLHVAISGARVVFAWRHAPFAASVAWITITELNTLAYMMLWPTLCTVLLNRQSLAAEAERGRRDELSGVLNRRGVLADMRRVGPGVLLLFDIDRFKQINDHFGHACGDFTIIAFVRLAERVLGDTVFGRIGGEEFVALVAPADLARAVVLAERVRTGFAAAELPFGVRATVSVGVAPAMPGEAVEAQLARADRALYRAKRLGRDRTEMSTDEDVAMVAEIHS